MDDDEDAGTAEFAANFEQIHKDLGIAPLEPWW